MATINFEHLVFDHIVEFTTDSTLFAVARENNSGHLRIFLVNQTSGNIYTRNGRADSWEQLGITQKYSVQVKLIAARHNRIPVYRIKGAHQ